MKSRLKINSVILGCVIVVAVLAVYWFGSTTHSALLGSEKEKIESFMAEFVEQNQFSGSLLVMHKGEVVLNEAYGLADRENKLPFTNHDLFPIGSVTKSMTAIAILQLEEQGKLSLQDTLSKYFPDFPQGMNITIHQLLSHSSGLGDYLAPEQIKEYTKAYSDQEILDIIYGQPLEAEHGEAFHYSNSGYFLLGKIIEKVSGKTYAQYMKHHIFDVAKMNHTFLIEEDQLQSLHVKGYENNIVVPNVHASLLFGAGNVLSTKEDLARYLVAIESHQLIGEQQVKKMLSGTIQASLFDYGYGWYIAKNFYTFDELLYTHGGSLPGLRTGVMRYKDQDLTIVIFNNQGEAWNYPALGNELASIIFEKRFWFFHKIQ